MATQPNSVNVQWQPVQSEVAALAHKHVTVTYAVLGWALGVILLLLAVGSLGGYFGFKSWQKAMDKAEVQEQRFEQRDQQYQQAILAFQKQLDADTAERQQASQKQAELQARIDQRASQPLPKPVADGLKPDATAQEAGNALGAIFTRPNAPVVPMATPEGKVAVSVKEAQEIASLGLDGQRSAANLQDETGLYTLEKAKSTSLSNDLTSCQGTLTQSQADLKEAKLTIADYKKVAKKSKWQRIWGGVKDYGLPVAAFILGSRLK